MSILLLVVPLWLARLYRYRRYYVRQIRSLHRAASPAAQSRPLRTTIKTVAGFVRTGMPLSADGRRQVTYVYGWVVEYIIVTGLMLTVDCCNAYQ